MSSAPHVVVKLKNLQGTVADYVLVDTSASNVFCTLVHTEGGIRDTARVRVLTMFYPISGDVMGLDPARFDKNVYMYGVFDRKVRTAALGEVTSMMLPASSSGVNTIVWDNSLGHPTTNDQT